MKKLFMILLSSLITQLGFGQDNNNLKDANILNTLSISPGLDYISLKDRTFSPIVFAGTAPKISLGFRQNRRNEKLWGSSISASVGEINHKSEYFESIYVSAQFTFDYLSLIKSIGKSKVYLGGQFRSELNILNYDDFYSGSWYTAQQLEPILIYKFIASGKQSITGQFSFPIIGLVGRPGYAGVDEFVVVNSLNIPKILYSKTKIQSLNKFINPTFKIEYSYNLPKIRFTLAANYSYLQVNSIRKYYRNELGFHLGFHFKFGKKNEN